MKTKTDCRRCADEEHQGWTNRETWATASEIDNNENRLDSVLELVRGNKGELAEAGLADELQAFIEDECEPGPFAHPDTVTQALKEAALSRVNWCELAEHYTAKARDGA